MSDLLPDRLGFNATPLLEDDKDEARGRKLKRRQVSNILEWVQCFGIYMAVLTEKRPEWVPDLLGYQALILEARMEYVGDGWLGYDRRFRQRAAANPDTIWARLDPTLWNIAFAGQARASRCKYCFSLTHLTEECDWAPPPPKNPQHPGPAQKAGTNRPRSRDTPVCFQWNHTPNPNCVYAGCKYWHTCLFCHNDPSVANKEHEAIFCPRRRQLSQRQSNSGQPPVQSQYTYSGNRFHPYQ